MLSTVDSETAAPFRAQWITPNFAVAASLGAHNFSDAARAGFSSIISLRPDSESGAFLRARRAAHFARTMGMTFHQFPVRCAEVMDPERITSFHWLLRATPGPVLATCRTGQRAALLWAFAACQSRPVERILQLAEVAGFDFAPLADELLDYAESIRAGGDAIGALRALAS